MAPLLVLTILLSPLGLMAYLLVRVVLRQPGRLLGIGGVVGRAHPPVHALRGIRPSANAAGCVDISGAGGTVRGDTEEVP